ncbi:MAG: amidohydrolase family protein [Chitinophagaceae bacterium]
MNKALKIDSHQHFWKFDPGRDTWITPEMGKIRRDFLPEDLIPCLKSQSIDGCMTIQTNQTEKETDFLISLAEKYDFIVGVIGWVDLRHPGIVERLNFYSSFKKLKGFRHIVQNEDNKFLLNQDFCRGIATLIKFNFTFDILIYPSQLPAAIRFVDQFPEQKFVIDHMAKPLIREGIWEPWATQIRKISSYKNVYCKVSGMVTEADWNKHSQQDFLPYLNWVFDCFGTDRLMFGSDWPVCLLAEPYSGTISMLREFMSNYHEEEVTKVFGGNAIKFYQC